MKVKLIYDANEGVSIPDGKCESFALDLINRGGELRFSNELFFTVFRLQVKLGKISPDDVEVLFFPPSHPHGICISLNHHGDCDNWPRGFCDNLDKYVMELIDWESSSTV